MSVGRPGLRNTTERETNARFPDLDNLSALNIYLKYYGFHAETKKDKKEIGARRER